MIEVETEIAAQTARRQSDAAPLAHSGIAADRASKWRFSDEIFVLNRPDTVRAEAIASLRNHLLGQHLRDGRRSLALCGPTADVGTTLIAANLAVGLAQADVNVLLIDGNLRQPKLQDYFIADHETRGLDQLFGEDDNAVTIEHGVLPNLSILFAGQGTVSSSEIIASNRFKALFDNCVRNFDLTIVVCPPSNVSSDSRRLAALARYAVLIARQDHTIISDYKVLVNEFQGDRIKVIGAFLHLG